MAAETGNTYISGRNMGPTSKRKGKGGRDRMMGRRGGQVRGRRERPQPDFLATPLPTNVQLLMIN